MDTVAVPSAKSIEEAGQALQALRALPGELGPRALEIRSETGGKSISITLPDEVFGLLLEILGQLANGSAVTVAPVHAELTTQQAADLLNVSRPFLVGLLDKGRIPFRRVGKHRRVRFSDLLEYKRREDEGREKVLAELASEAQELGLGY